MTEPEQRPNGYHVMPCYGREHDSNPECWCCPEPLPETLDRKEYWATIWIHREEN